MALVQGVHILAHGQKSEARRIAIDIQQHQRLLVGTNTMYGAGVYAWYQHTLPLNLYTLPRVLFEVDDNTNVIVPICKRDGTRMGFFLIRGNIHSYVSISVRNFVDLW